MVVKSPQDRIEKSQIKKDGNQNLSKQDTVEDKKKSKLRKRKIYPQEFYELDLYADINNNITVSEKSTNMGSYFNPNSGMPNYSLPCTCPWDVITPQNLYPVAVPPLPLALVSPPMPLIPAVIYTPTYPPVLPYDNICSGLDYLCGPVSSFAALTPRTSTEEDFIEEDTSDTIKPLDYYLTLPKDLFPKAKMVTLDPNPIIDELCKLKDIGKHTPWILDLEFGVPRNTVSRPLAVYDVQFNNIHCKNTPGTVHPLFQSCSQEFRKIFLFYYDCIVSVWYRGYIRLKNDDSVMNFQNWLVVPMQSLGMCWS